MRLLDEDEDEDEEEDSAFATEEEDRPRVNEDLVLSMTFDIMLDVGRSCFCSSCLSCCPCSCSLGSGVVVSAALTLLARFGGIGGGFRPPRGGGFSFFTSIKST